MAAEKFIQLDTSNGGLKEVSLVDSSAGAGDSGKGVALDSAGKLNLNMMPTGVGPELQPIMADTGGVAAGDFVNVFDSAGTSKCRKADATTGGKRAHGFVKATVTAGNMVDVYFDGANTSLTGLTSGTRMFLGTTPGQATATAPSTSLNLVQYLGTALNSTTIAFRPTDGVVLA